jgi:uncharacterized integral membrane protein
MRREPEHPGEDLPASSTTDRDVPQTPPAASFAEQEHLERLERERRARLAKALLGLAAAIVLIVFVVANSQPVQVNFVFITRHPRLIWVMVACAVLGGVVGYLLGRPGKQLRLGRRRAKKGGQPARDADPKDP